MELIRPYFSGEAEKGQGIKVQAGAEKIIANWGELGLGILCFGVGLGVGVGLVVRWWKKNQPALTTTCIANSQ